MKKKASNKDLVANRKLALKPETIAVLAPKHLGEVIGGLQVPPDISGRLQCT